MYEVENCLSNLLLYLAASPVRVGLRHYFRAATRVVLGVEYLLVLVVFSSARLHLLELVLLLRLNVVRVELCWIYFLVIF
jgi:hypothetical protein